MEGLLERIDVPNEHSRIVDALPGLLWTALPDGDVGFVNKVLAPFHSTKTDGMGIGLSISRSIVESDDGHLWAGPNDGPGVMFAFSIPRSREAATITQGTT
jgi:hypothetical protein